METETKDPTEPSSSGVTQLLCSFVTKLPDSFRVPPDPLAVPANLTRLGLSQVINAMLDLLNPLPFDFLIDGRLLRDRLDAHVSARGLSTEATLQIEYMPVTLPPSQGPAVEVGEEWLTSLAHVPEGWLVFGDFAGRVGTRGPELVDGGWVGEHGTG